MHDQSNSGPNLNWSEIGYEGDNTRVHSNFQQFEFMIHYRWIYKDTLKEISNTKL